MYQNRSEFKVLTVYCIDTAFILPAISLDPDHPAHLCSQIWIYPSPTENRKIFLMKMQTL